MSLSHMWVQQNASVIECYALLIVAKLVVYGPNEQQYISLVGIDQVYLQPQRTSQGKKGAETMGNAGSLCFLCEEAQCSVESVKMVRNARGCGRYTELSWLEMRRAEHTDWQSCKAL